MSLPKVLTKFLPLSGGTMTGQLTVPSWFHVLKENNEYEGGQIVLQGAGSYTPVYMDNFKGYPRMFYDVNGQISWLLNFPNQNGTVEAVESKSTNYIRYVNGLQICWGTVAVPALAANATGSTAVTLPGKFINTSYNVTFAQQIDSGNSWHLGVYAFTKQTASMTVYFRNGNTTALSSANGVYSYTAIGFWK